MADSNSHQPRCACGFWGSAQTLGLCSKCYKEHQKKNSADGSGPQSSSSCSASASIVANSLQEALESSEPIAMETNASETPVFSNASETPVFSNTSETPVTVADAGTNGDSKAELATEPESTEEPSAAEQEGQGDDGDKPAKDQPVPGTKRERNDSESTDPDRPVQKNKKRCYKCNCKLELAIREIGRCRCDYVFCQMHRLPEQHDCIFNHKEKGRQEARDKMVSPKKHVGNSVKRIDSDS